MDWQFHWMAMGTIAKILHWKIMYSSLLSENEKLKCLKLGSAMIEGCCIFFGFSHGKCFNNSFQENDIYKNVAGNVSIILFKRTIQEFSFWNTFSLMRCKFLDECNIRSWSVEVCQLRQKCGLSANILRITEYMDLSNANMSLDKSAYCNVYLRYDNALKNRKLIMQYNFTKNGYEDLEIRNMVSWKGCGVI